MKKEVRKMGDVFPMYKLTNERTLFECAFFDAHYRYFDEINDEFLSEIQAKEEDLILDYNFGWPDFYQDIGINAIRSRIRPIEMIETWGDVSYEYLCAFSDSCVFLESRGFLFFLPAAIFNCILMDDFKTNRFMYNFINRLDLQWGKDSEYFNDNQKKFISAFVKQYFDGDVGWVV